MNELYTLQFKTSTGQLTDLSDYSGKVLLLVNTATQCGLAGQFKELEVLHQQYKDKGLVVIGFPCDQFMGQEPESNEDMVGVCLKNFGVTFLLSEKIKVNGPDTHPVFTLLKAHTKSKLGSAIKWNFTKFLISADGTRVQRYAPTIQPATLETDIKALLTERH